MNARFERDGIEISRHLLPEVALDRARNKLLEVARLIAGCAFGDLAMSAGDVLFFRFDVLHRSLPVSSSDKSRWTVQTRFADFADAHFRNHSFKPASVSPGNAPYLENEPTDVRPHPV